MPIIRRGQKGSGGKLSYIRKVNGKIVFVNPHNVHIVHVNPFVPKGRIQGGLRKDIKYINKNFPIKHVVNVKVYKYKPKKIEGLFFTPQKEPLKEPWQIRLYAGSSRETLLHEARHAMQAENEPSLLKYKKLPKPIARNLEIDAKKFVKKFG